MNTPKQSLDCVVMAIGMLRARHIDRSFIECLVESAVVLAHAAGIPKDQAVAPFDMSRGFAESIWNDLEKDHDV
jgi:hypothetical protein